MAFTRHCPKGGLVLSDGSASTCPGCGTWIVAFAGVNRWWRALLQITLSTVFMLVFRFPKIMIVIFGG
jgi:hypothetical protein